MKATQRFMMTLRDWRLYVLPEWKYVVYDNLWRMKIAMLGSIGKVGRMMRRNVKKQKGSTDAEYYRWSDHQ